MKMRTLRKIRALAPRHLRRRDFDLSDATMEADPGPPPELVIVEVRWRRSRAFGLADESLDHRKRRHLRAAIGRLIADGLPDGRLPELPLRVDLVVVEPAAMADSPFRMRHHRAIPV